MSNKISLRDALLDGGNVCGYSDKSMGKNPNQRTKAKVGDNSAAIAARRSEMNVKPKVTVLAGKDYRTAK